MKIGAGCGEAVAQLIDSTGWWAEWDFCSDPGCAGSHEPAPSDRELCAIVRWSLMSSEDKREALRAFGEIESANGKTAVGSPEEAAEEASRLVSSFLFDDGGDATTVLESLTIAMMDIARYAGPLQLAASLVDSASAKSSLSESVKQCESATEKLREAEQIIAAEQAKSVEHHHFCFTWADYFQIMDALDTLRSTPETVREHIRTAYQASKASEHAIIEAVTRHQHLRLWGYTANQIREYAIRLLKLDHPEAAKSDGPW